MPGAPRSKRAPILLAVHGGAGRIERGRFPPDGAQEAALRAGLGRALRAGHAVLAARGAALDAVVAAVAVLEEDPSFNAGRGAVLTRDGRVEMDAAVMDGATRRAGAVACVSGVASPVRLARAVMERTPHVLLVGAGAEALAAEAGVARVDPARPVTPERREQLARARERERVALDHDGASAAAPDADPPETGTVGAVARDAAGRLAAATSTGGLTNQLPGRVGDSPIPGAGTWADGAVAVSATGDGEGFLRSAFAHEVAAGVRLAGRPVADAAREALARVSALGLAGGCIAVGCEGDAALPFTTLGMLRGVAGADGVPRVALYGGEALAAAGAGDAVA